MDVSMIPKSLESKICKIQHKAFSFFLKGVSSTEVAQLKYLVLNPKAKAVDT